MSASRVLRTRTLDLSKCLVVIAAVLALAALVGCGGGSGGNSPSGPTFPSVNNICSTGTYNGTAANPQFNTYFGMHIHSLAPGTPWPSTDTLSNPSDSVDFGGLRLWDSGTGWADINTSAGVCSFNHMDSWLAETQSNNVDVVYNLGRTPTWASTNPHDGSCSYTADGGDGQCDPPEDLGDDGGGPDAIWIGWVTSVVSRYKGQIKYYEIWNEWNIDNFWVGTTAQLVRMTQDARCVIEGPPPTGSCNSNSTFPGGTALDPDAKILNPSAVGSQSTLNAVQKNTSNYLNTQVDGMGPASFIDVVGFHCYVSTQTVGLYPVPEDVLTVINDLTPILPSGLQNAPLFCTEGGWGEPDQEGFTDPDLQAAFLARYYLLQNSDNVARVYWYAWNTTSTDTGALWNSTTGVATLGATAYAEVYKWITGATLSTPCAKSGSVWTCAYTRSNGYEALAVWDGNVSGNGSGGGSACYAPGAPTCTTFSVPSQYTLYRDLSGNETAVSGSTIPISAKPVLLETSTLP